jgi:hypothetical protein
MRFRLRTLMILAATVVAAAAFADEKPDPGKALYGEWEVVEMIYRATVQDFQGKCGGWFIFDKEGVIIVPAGEPNAKERAMFQRIKGAKNGFRHATAIRPSELDIEFWFPWRSYTTKASYELKDGKLRILWGDNENERPTDFDEAYKDMRLTYYVLQKVK